MVGLLCHRWRHFAMRPHGGYRQEHQGPGGFSCPGAAAQCAPLPPVSSPKLCQYTGREEMGTGLSQGSPRLSLIPIPAAAPAPHPFIATFLGKNTALPLTAQSQRAGGTASPSPTAGQPPPSSPLLQEMMLPPSTFSPSPRVLRPRHRNYSPQHRAKNTAGAASSWARGRVGAHGGMRGESSRWPLAHARSRPGTAGPLPAAPGDSRRGVCPGRGSALTR